MTLASTIELGPRAGIEACTDFQISNMEVIYNNSCNRQDTQTCVAIVGVMAEYINTDDDNVTWAWSASPITPGATISLQDPTDQNTIELWVTSDVDVTHIEVTCTATYVTTGAVSDRTIEVVTTHRLIP